MKNPCTWNFMFGHIIPNTNFSLTLTFSLALFTIHTISYAQIFYIALFLKLERECEIEKTVLCHVNLFLHILKDILGIKSVQHSTKDTQIHGVNMFLQKM